MTRIDETWHRLREWTLGQPPSERLAAQILVDEGYEGIDPSHPLGGPDGGRDAHCTKDGKNWIMGVYFPRGQQTENAIRNKFHADLTAARTHNPDGFVFVTNQEITLAPRKELRDLGDGIEVELYHLERITLVLDKPSMAPVRKQYLDIDPGPLPIAVELEIEAIAQYFADSAEVLENFVENTIEAELDKFDSQPAPEPRSDIDWLVNFQLLGTEQTTKSEKPTRDELEHRLDGWAKQVRRGWDEGEAHLAATAWAGVCLHLRNVGNVFLNDVEVIVTIRGAQGLWWEDPDDFELDKVLPGFAVSHRSPTDVFWQPTQDLMKHFRTKDYPVDWENVDGDAVKITINLDHLRPFPVWTSNDWDVVIVAVEVDAEELRAEWTVTAQGYGHVYEGPAVKIPVKPASFIDVLGALLPDGETED